MKTARSRSIIAKPIEHDRAFITSLVPFGESDCIIRLFTKKFGRIAAFARRGLAHKKGASVIQAPAIAEVGLVFSENKLTRLDVCDIDPILACSQVSSLRVFGYSAYLAELIEKFVPESDPSPEIFELIEEAFGELIRSGAKGSLLRAFELKLLLLLGYLPEFDEAMLHEDAIAFDPVGCRFSPEMADGFITFSKEALILARSMLIAKLGHVNYEESHELMMIGRIFQSRLKMMGFFPLKTVVFLRQLSGH